MAAQEDIDKLVSTIQSLKNRDLVQICVANHLAKSGNKADLQKRIVNLIDAAFQDPNPQKFVDIQSSILAFGRGSSSVNYRVPNFASSLPSSPSYLPSGMSSPYSGNSTTNGNVLHRSGGYGGSAGYGGELGQRLPPNGLLGLQFKPSPFYEIDTQLGDVRPCEAMAQHRNSVPVQIRVSSYPALQRCLVDQSLRVMIFCAASNVGVQEIAFPYQCEIKVNGGEVKANLRGLKNKPGSTRPVDITSLLRLKPSNYNNTLDFTYALTAKRFYLALYICKAHTASELTRVIERRRITKDSVIREVTRQAQDPDVVATSQVLSLKCPLTYMRLSLPIRSMTCKHIQCFDATSYLQLQEQGPQWLCPVCSRTASFDTLAVDEYVKEILAKTPSDQDQVTIDPDGTWHAEKPKNGNAPSTPKEAATSLLDEDESIFPFSGLSASEVRESMGRASTASVVAYRDATATPVHAGSKRQREVIDLTLSDDDEDAHLPPVKRQHIASSGFSPIPYSTL
ncbi:sumo ligase [Grosmannia clavigera kw1407]|uniref:Sumo ligase n=1 Tax=Grosmannia clavigera (strain kw1407 / UAMH 11150) TaxID=655863 RepID=F0XPM7_GROCL|nr:sumo ligase [Grosmannia clavigera kw1407]EFX00288.1 sumo ligase [Grosmannia clavigera kw1407]